MILLLENNIRGGISSVMENRYVKSDENLKEKTKSFPFAPVNKKTNLYDFSDSLKTIKPDTYTQTKTLICDWSDKKTYLFHYRMLKFYDRHGMVVDKIHEVIPYKQSNWLEEYMNFNTQKRN